MSQLRLRPGMKLLPHQRAFARWQPSQQSIEDGFSEELILGGWGSAKSTGMLAKVLIVASQNPRHAGYVEIAPRVIVTGPSDRAVQKNLIPKFMQMLPRQLIRSRTGKPYASVTLVNGCVIEFVSFEAVLEGDDVAGLAVDEFHLIRDNAVLQNLRNRVRDPLARRRAFLGAGLPESGWVREYADPEGWGPEQHARRQTMLVGTDANTHLPKAHLESILSSCPSGYEAALVGGGWLPARGGLYPQYDPRIHLVPDSRVAHGQALDVVGMDLGVHSAAVLAQRQGQDCLVVGDVTATHSSAADLARAVLAHPYGHLVQAGVTTIAVDPTTREDELRAVRSVFVGCRVLKRQRLDAFYAVEPGVRLMQAALLNAAGETRLRFVESLRRSKFGVLDALLSVRVSERTGMRVKDDRHDHAEDALRYAVQTVLGDRGFAPMVSRR